jgi:hypothetical protein
VITTLRIAYICGFFLTLCTIPLLAQIERYQTPAGPPKKLATCGEHPGMCPKREPPRMSVKAGTRWPQVWVGVSNVFPFVPHIFVSRLGTAEDFWSSRGQYAYFDVPNHGEWLIRCEVKREDGFFVFGAVVWRTATKFQMRAWRDDEREAWFSAKEARIAEHKER